MTPCYYCELKEEECQWCIHGSFSAVEELRAENDRLKNLIFEWAEDHKWCAEGWKKDPTNAALLKEAGEE